MKPPTLTRTALTMALTLAITLATTTAGHADEPTTPADPAMNAPAAPAPDAAKALEPGGGCMPGGGCCGACQQAATAAAPGDPGARAATGGCPCQKNRQ